MRGSSLNGRLLLDGQWVGEVAVDGWHGAWGMGHFTPNPAFDEFAPIFVEWGRLMHADLRRLSRDNARRLRQIECQLYTLHARLWIVPMREWRVIDMLTIEGNLIEWKEGWLDRQDDMAQADHAKKGCYADYASV